MVKDYVWTSEKLAEKSLETVKLVRERAIANANTDLLVLCDSEIARRSPLKPTKKAASAVAKNGHPVKGYHLVCRRERGVVLNDDGTFWSGSWVIAKSQVERSEVINAYVALHEKQSEDSYLQGVIKGWRPAPRDRVYADQERETEEGIEFLLEPMPDPLPWRGGGIVERSYWYGDDGASSSD